MKEHRGNKQSIISINSSVILRAHVGNEKQHLMFHGKLTKRSFNVNTCSSPLIHTEIVSSFNYVLFLKKRQHYFSAPYLWDEDDKLCEGCSKYKAA